MPFNVLFRSRPSLHQEVPAGEHMKSRDLNQRMLSAVAATVLAIGGAVVAVAPAQASSAAVEGQVLDASGKPIKGIGIGDAPGYAYTTSNMSAPISLRILTFATTAKPTITGTPQVGKQLVANAGAWTPGTTHFAYQWYRAGEKISGAVDQQYIATIADYDKDITVAVTGWALGDSPVTAISAPTARVAWGGPVYLPGVELSASRGKIGSKLTAYAMDAALGAEMKYQWYRSGKPINGANNETYRVVGVDGGRSLKVSVTASLPGYDNATKYSGSISIPKGTLTTKKPTITGTKNVGRTLTAKHGTWTSETKFKYQWYRSGKPIKGADNKTYKLAKADRSRSVKVQITGSKTGYKSTTRYSSTHRIR
ncbi:hypothetical protein ACFY5D_08325 [Paeniglutamicibacter sp. NPDC012692]|uniref:hypothetical protein n=1 Tax=Paeniglutamicibacter sp. NPDC012692 TaxID=3364388 RepID=UPI00368570E3